MQEYISKQHQILRPAEQIYAVISRFDNLTPALADRVEEWQATEDTCSFKAKGFTVKLRMEERIAPKHVKIVGDEGGVPIDFAFWIQLQPAGPYDTRLRLEPHTDLNMMTLSAGLSTLNGQYTTNFPVLMAGSLLAMIPMVILYLIFQKQFIQGIAMTGGK